MRGSDIIFDRVNFLHFKYHKINLKHGGLYVNSPDWIKNKKSNENDDDKCLQYTTTFTLYHEEIGENSQRISKSKPFTSKCNWIGTNYPFGQDDWKEIQKNNPKIALNVLYVKEMNKYSAYVSKHNLNYEKEIILLTIQNGDR